MTRKQFNIHNFRRLVVAIMDRESAHPAFARSSDIDGDTFQRVFARDTAHALAHGIDAETVALRLIEEIRV